MEVQSVMFDKSKFTQSQAERTLNEMHYQPIKSVHITPNYYRYRIIDPARFHHLVTSHAQNGVLLVMGFL